MPSSSDPAQHGRPFDDDAVPGPDEVSDGFPRMSRLNLALLLLSIASMCAALYLSPAGDEVRASVRQALPGTSDTAASPTASPSATPTGRATPLADAVGTEVKRPALTASPTHATSGVHPLGTGSGSGGTSSVLALSPPSHGPSAAPSASGSPSPSASPSPSPSPSPSHGPTVAAEPTKCWQFTWQQDAQAVYVTNLSDPFGLDAGVGPNDGDGLACSDLPVDPARPASTPVGAYVPPKPTVATKASLVRPAKDYFGFVQDGVPGNGAMMDSLADRAGKAPSTVGWFTTFDTGYRGDLVEKAWNHGALPVITWMPTDEGSGTSYSLGSIVNGTHDRYLRRYAGDVVRAGLPVGIRFAHEMNGNWYGWSAGRTDYNNSPAKYVAAWRHIWQVFDDVGATDDVIWIWSPTRVDAVRPSPTNGLTALADDYPGDTYVDWVGASVYLRYAATGPTYAASFGRTVASLEAVTNKPIFFGEMAAVQSDAGVDETALKADWIGNVLSTFADDPQVVGFQWFNNVRPTVVNGVSVTNDWRFDSADAARDAFRSAVDRPAFAGGVPLDPTQ